MSTLNAIGIDPRGPRFGALLTTIVLAVVAVTGSVWLLLVQTGLFAIGAFFGVQKTPAAWLYAKFVRPRIGAPALADLEDPAPPRFAQVVGLVITAVTVLLTFLVSHTALLIGTLIAFVAAFLNAFFGYCLGCELYVLIQKARAKS